MVQMGFLHCSFDVNYFAANIANLTSYITLCLCSTNQEVT